MIYFKFIGLFWLFTIIFFLVRDSFEDFFSHLAEAEEAKLKSLKENLGFVIIGSGFFGLLVGVNAGSPELEILVRIVLASIFAIMGIKLIKTGL
ncbi:MAG: hypothetical protein DSZ27_07125 [Thiomicrospira sp.]|nr:MAG: hypothetical protein DSZ27_07125 [Thiomicrospira sp.]